MISSSLIVNSSANSARGQRQRSSAPPPHPEPAAPCARRQPVLPLVLTTSQHVPFKRPLRAQNLRTRVAASNQACANSWPPRLDMPCAIPWPAHDSSLTALLKFTGVMEGSTELADYTFDLQGFLELKGA